MVDMFSAADGLYSAAGGAALAGLLFLTVAALAVAPVRASTATPMESLAETLNRRADEALERMIAVYWDPVELHFHKFSDRSGWTDFWWLAQVWDAVMDGVVRSRERGQVNTEWLRLLDYVYSGQAARTPTFTNQFYDDEAWWALASLRAYEITGNRIYLHRAEALWADIRTGWSDELGGGIYWRKDERRTKNACINGPAALLAARLYAIEGRPEDLQMAERIFAWLKATLVSPWGLVWDNVAVVDGSIDKRTFTYNQGTFIGAAVALYKATGKAEYLADARRVADATLRYLVDENGLLRNEGTGDGGGFKGIFVRYLVSLVDALPTTDPYRSDRERYLAFLVKNASMAWEKARNAQGLFASNWAGPPRQERVESLTNASGVMLLNLTALAVWRHGYEL